MSRQGLRADAERNRHQLLRSARQVFAERGLDAPLDEIARRAGVGNATLYRRFPTRCDLVAAVFADALAEIVQAAERALDDPDPWSGFAAHLTFLCEVQAGNRALADLLTAAVSGAPELETLRARAHGLLVELIRRAKDGGRLRPDFAHQDVVLILMANAGLLERTSDAAPTAWRRHVGYVLDGLRVPTDAVVAPGPDECAVVEAMTALAERRGCA